MARIRLRVRYMFYVISCALIGACNSNPPLTNPVQNAKSYDAAGSLHVAVLSTAPWGEVVSKLQPTFEMTPALALASVNPVTATISDRAFSGQAFGLNLALPSSGVNTNDTSSTSLSRSVDGQNSAKISSSSSAKTGLTASNGTSASTASTDTSDASTDESSSTTRVGKTTTTTSERSRFRQSASAADAAVKGLVNLGEKGAAGLADKPESFRANPELQYAAARSLYTAIQTSNISLLNAVKRAGYAAEFVEMQISLQPKMRDLPYDAYINVSFFANTLDKTLKENRRRARGESAVRAAEDALSTAGATPLARSPVVIPILVSDNLESTSSVRNLEALRQVTLGLSGVVNGFGLGAQAGNLNDRIQALQGNQINSLMTLGRITDNTIRVRIGAMNQGIAGQLMVARTHNVALLVLVPSGTDRVSIVAKADFIDPRDGTALPTQSAEDGEQRLGMIGVKYSEHCLSNAYGAPSERLMLLDTLAFLGNRAAFDTELWRERPPKKATVWGNLTRDTK